MKKLDKVGKALANAGQLITDIGGWKDKFLAQVTRIADGVEAGAKALTKDDK